MSANINNEVFLPWTLEEAIPFVRELENIASKFGFHIGLTGGVLYKGQSDKDLDIVIYPHKTDVIQQTDQFVAALVEQGFERWELRGHSHLLDGKKVYAVVWQGKRIDLFFLYE